MARPPAPGAGSSDAFVHIHLPSSGVCPSHVVSPEPHGSFSGEAQRLCWMWGGLAPASCLRQGHAASTPRGKDPGLFLLTVVHSSSSGSAFVVSPRPSNILGMWIRDPEAFLPPASALRVPNRLPRSKLHSVTPSPVSLP